MTPTDDFAGQKNRDILISNAINLKNLKEDIAEWKQDYGITKKAVEKNTAYRNFMLGIGSVITLLLSYGVFFVR